MISIAELKYEYGLLFLKVHAPTALQGALYGWIVRPGKNLWTAVCWAVGRLWKSLVRDLKRNVVAYEMYKEWFHDL